MTSVCRKDQDTGAIPLSLKFKKMGSPQSEVGGVTGWGQSSYTRILGGEGELTSKYQLVPTRMSLVCLCNHLPISYLPRLYFVLAVGVSPRGSFQTKY